MKKIIFFVCLFSTIFSVFSQKKTKKGFSFGALPAISYDSDLGFQYGALVNLFHYGDGSRFPKYDHSLYLEYSTFTKGTSIARLRYDSERLIPMVRTTFDIAYVTDLMADFYGFNGFQSDYNSILSNATKIFYKNERNMFRVKTDFQGCFGQSKIGWVAGYSFYNFALDSVNISKLNLSPVVGGSLFQRYQSWGLIKTDEAKGGNIHYFKIGLKYDSRDQLACPMKGIWTEAVIQNAPKFVNEVFPHTKLAIIHRQYFTLTKDMSFAYRIDYQATVGNNHVPYYAQPLLITSFLTAATNQGLGGKNSIRGVLRNRVVGDAVGFANLEWRYKFLRFDMFKQNFYLGTNVFFDTGIILKPIEINPSVISAYPSYFNTYSAGKFHSGAGVGLKIGWNENFVISADFGKAFNKQDGNTGMYIGLNYLF